MTDEAYRYSLIDAEDSILVVIDVQDAFLGKLPHADRERILSSICWIVKLAQWKGIPLVITAEEYAEQPLAEKLLDTLPAGTPILDKHVFGLAHQPDILAAVEQTSRRTTVLVGLETDVCVMQSAVGLLEAGYRVAAVTDATGTPAPNHELGLKRMRSAGAILVNLKGLFYEWLRTVAEVQRFHKELPEMRGLAGVVL
ncbi:MAG TPA: isochorismatase family protein [Anaerolineales bacterium]|nr:isochorismatase family protein [Anaerolineales bacterium]